MEYDNPTFAAGANSGMESNAASGASTEMAAAIQQFTQAVQELSSVVRQFSSSGASLTTSAAGPQINTWEDDPFSAAEAVPQPVPARPIPVNLPANNNPLLQIRFTTPPPPPARYAPGTAEFRFWTAAEALTRGINFWTPLLPAGTRWSTANPMQVTLIAGQDFNANYSRPFGLRFYQGILRGVSIYSGESPDITCHELGHAILDALKPQLFSAASLEAASFHESFGDMSAILSALQLPTLRQKVLSETNGQINVNSRLSRLAEQLGWAIRQLSPTAVDADCLRNAANRFFYRPPAQLPPSAPATMLSSEPHSFSRIFTGAFLDALARMLKIAGVSDVNLSAVSQDMGRLLAEGVRTARILPAYYSQVAASMIQADQTLNQGRYRSALSSAFIQHGVLSPAAAAALAAAQVPEVTSPAGAAAVSMAGSGLVDDSRTGSETFLSYNGDADDGYRQGPENSPELPLLSVSTDYGVQVLVHASSEVELFAVAAANIGGGSAESPSPIEAANAFVESLIQQGRIDFEAVRNVIPEEIIPLTDARPRKTHTLVNTPEGQLLKRLYFDCGFHCQGGR